MNVSLHLFSSFFTSVRSHSISFYVFIIKTRKTKPLFSHCTIYSTYYKQKLPFFRIFVQQFFFSTMVLHKRICVYNSQLVSVFCNMKYIHKHIVTINLMVPLMNRWKIALFLISDLLLNEHTQIIFVSFNFYGRATFSQFDHFTYYKKRRKSLAPNLTKYYAFYIYWLSSDDGGSYGSRVFYSLFL